LTTSRDPRRVPGSQPGHPVLAQLISIDPERFATDYWGTQALLSPADELPGGFAGLLTSDAIDELLSERGLRTPFLRVAKNGSTLAEKAFTGPGGVGATIGDQVSDDKLVRLFADGSTLVLQALHRVWPPIIEFCQRLADELGHPVQANAYTTPPQNQGFSNHYDVHDVFVLQLEGSKRWQIHSPVLEAPLRDQPWNDRKADVEARAAERPLIEAVLEPGDCLYLPRGFLHAAKALGGVSTHLTIGVHSWTRFALAEDMLRQALEAVARDPAIRRSLPLGVDFADSGHLRSDIDLVRRSLVDALEAADLDEVLRTLRRNACGTQRAAPIGPLRQLRDADRITAESTIGLRKHLAASLDQIGGRSTVRGRAGDFPLPEEDVAPMKTLLESGSCRADDLGLDLARRLVLAGLANVE
jgi:bifunctional lysine-specific demethylase and histidyl-hydroxylase NO66